MRQILLITGGVIAAIALIIGLFTFNQVTKEEADLTARLEARTEILTESLAQSILPSYETHATTSIKRTIDKFAGNQRLAGLVVYDSSGAVIASSDDSPDAVDGTMVNQVMDAAEGSGMFARNNDDTFYVFAVPIIDDAGSTIGAMASIQSANYIDTTIWNIWRDNLIRFLLQTALIAAAIFALVRWVFFKPLSNLAESIRAARRGETVAEDAIASELLYPISTEIAKITGSLRQARNAASQEARMRLEKLDSPWTAERLKEFVKAYIKERPIFIVSNGEPYVNTLKNGKEIEWTVPAGGLVTALEPVMEATGGTWIAHGAGAADKQVVDSAGNVQVPHDEPRYTLKRIWLSQKEVAGYYNGFSNEALWPLCHMAHVRPIFRKEDWVMYRKVNGLFAKTVLEEIRGVERPLIFVQDYHLSLVPAMIKKSRPDAQVAIFWHIPWPSAAQFSICPWREEILEGMLGADLVGFQTQQYANNFLDTVASEIEARIDLEHFSIFRDEHRTFVKPFPISIAFPGVAEREETEAHLLEHLGVRSEYVALGVDRLDYIKGIPERLKGIEFFFDRHPEYKGRLTLLQIASPTRSTVDTYRRHADHVIAEVDRINGRFGTRDWKPIVLQHRSFTHGELRELYRRSQLCLVTSLHDGMNLVAKEYAAAHGDEAGCLILSQFAGASRNMKGAILINPYSAEETAEAIYKAVTMPKTEQHRRMKAMRGSVRDYNVYRWSAELTKTLAELD